MSKSEELLRMERDMNEHPELREKPDAEIKGIIEAKEAESDGELMVMAAALGCTITIGEMERAIADPEKPDDEAPETAGGETTPTGTYDNYNCMCLWHKGEKRSGRKNSETALEISNRLEDRGNSFLESIGLKGETHRSFHLWQNDKRPSISVRGKKRI